jgi:hypothetical protein
MKQDLGRWLFKEYISSQIRGNGGDYFGPGSENAMVTGEGFIRAFRGVGAVSAETPARMYFQVDQEWAGLGSATVNPFGSVFLVRELLMYIGLGQVVYNGAAIAGVIADENLSYIKKSGSDFVPGIGLGPFQAGHAQPNPPIIYPHSNPSPGQYPISGTVAVKVWRVSELTGQTSLASFPSNVLVLSSQSVIVQFPGKDFNGQTHWGIGVPKIGFDILGVFYELPTDLYGEVAESTLSYTRTVTGASIAAGTNVVNVTDPVTANQFTSSDLGRRIAFGGFDSWITAINSATQVQVNGTNTTAGTISADATITHAVDGITRAIEISWTNGALIQQNLVPDKAFEPDPAQFAGNMNDVLWLDDHGTIFIGEPGEIGSFPPDSVVFASEPAVQYLPGGDALLLRFGKHSFGVFMYVGGSPAMEYQEIWHDLGIEYPQNVARGSAGRLMMWLDRPVIVEGTSPDFNYGTKIAEFATWGAQQTAETPIVPGYDGIGDYEVWCLKQTVICKYVPKDAWCAPINLAGKINGNIVASLTHHRKLYLTANDGATLTRYLFDAGAGSVMKVQTSDVRPNGYGATITEINVQGRTDNTTLPVVLELISNYDDANPILLYQGNPPRLGPQDFIPTDEPNIIDSKQHAIRLTINSTGGTSGFDFVETKGELNEVRTPA